MRRVRILVYKLRIVIMFPWYKLKKNRVDITARLNVGVLNRSTVGKYTYIGPNAVINNTEIGNYTSIAPGVQIGGMEHSINWYSTSTFLSNRCVSHNKTYIGNNVWIAANAIIKQGVKIGDGSVIGAGAFVNKDIPSNCVAVGVPAVVIKKRINDEMLELISGENFWNKNPKEIKKILGE